MTSHIIQSKPQECPGMPSAADLSSITDELLQVLDARSKDIVTRRFGLKSDNRETLESIGKEYGITRERVRQIEANAKKSLSSLEGTLKPAIDFINQIFSKHGGVLTEPHIIDIVQLQSTSAVSNNVIHFHLDISPHVRLVSASDLFLPHWRLDRNVYAHIDEIVINAVEILKGGKHPQPFEKLLNDIRSKLRGQEVFIPEEYIMAALMASKHVSLTAYKDWGLVGWAETSPRGVGDKSYAVLRRHGKPAHFREITDLINEARFDHKIANAQTVHNELIKDKRFVLVGRGLYGLREWGYMSGTVADVLESILKKAEQPLSRDELINKVLKQRLVKKNTILLSLQNNKRFEKTGENRYTLKQPE